MLMDKVDSSIIAASARGSMHMMDQKNKKGWF